MYETCWYRIGEDERWIKGVCRFLIPTGGLVTAEGDGKVIWVTIGNLWLHQYAPDHSQFG